MDLVSAISHVSWRRSDQVRRREHHPNEVFARDSLWASTAAAKTILLGFGKGLRRGDHQMSLALSELRDGSSSGCETRIPADILLNLTASSTVVEANHSRHC